MSLNYLNLDDSIRQLMLSEVQKDIDNNCLYLSKRLSSTGIQDYPDLLKTAVTSHNDSWLCSELNRNNRLNKTETRNKPKGGFTTVNVPLNASEVLSEGEFNRFYIRAVCLEAIKKGTTLLEIYRAKHVENPRPESIAKIGKMIDPSLLLADLRKNMGTDTALGLPPGPNSGLSVKLP